MPTVTVSTITPVYAGSDYLNELVKKIEQLREKWNTSSSPLQLHEAIFVNDDSSDNSLDILYELEQKYPWIHIINLSRNFGQHQATIAGILHSSSDWVVTLDEDLQHDPVFIDDLLKKAVNSESDIIYAHPEKTVHKGSLFRDWSSQTFKKLVSFLTGNKHTPKFNSFRLIRGSIARASGKVCTHGTYYDIVLGWFTGRVSTINLPLEDLRFSENGKSGYTLRKLISHARKMVISSEAKVVRFGAAIGFLAIAAAVILGLKIFFHKLFFPDSIPVQGWTSLFLTMLFFCGLLAILLGIVLEYITVILLHIQGKPTYFSVDRRSDHPLREYYKK